MKKSRKLMPINYIQFWEYVVTQKVCATYKRLVIPYFSYLRSVYTARLVRPGRKMSQNISVNIASTKQVSYGRNKHWDIVKDLHTRMH